MTVLKARRGQGEELCTTEGNALKHNVRLKKCLEISSALSLKITPEKAYEKDEICTEPAFRYSCVSIIITPDFGVSLIAQSLHRETPAGWDTPKAA